MAHLWEESVDVCTWGIRPLTHLSIRRQLPSLLFYVLKFHLEFEVCCFKKQFGSITPRSWVHPLVRQLSRSKALSWGQLRPCLCYFLYLLPLGWSSISCHLRFSNRCLLCQTTKSMDFSTSSAQNAPQELSRELLGQWLSSSSWQSHWGRLPLKTEGSGDMGPVLGFHRGDLQNIFNSLLWTASTSAGTRTIVL